MFSTAGRMELASQLVKDESDSVEALELSLLLQRNIFVERMGEMRQGTDIYNALVKAIGLADQLLKILKSAEGDLDNLNDAEAKRMHKEYEMALNDMANSVMEGLLATMLSCDCEACRAKQEEQPHYLN